MGGIIYSRFERNDAVQGRDEVAISVFSDVGLTSADLDRFWNLFTKMDVKKCGAVTKLELYKYFQIEENKLTTKLFRSFDIDNSGKLDFCEFTVNFWNYLTIDDYYLPSFVFHTFDDDDNGTLDWFEVKSLVEIIHGQSAEKNVHLKQLLADLQDLTPIDQPEFRRFCADNQSVYYPLVSLKLTLHEKLFGVLFWNRMVERRQKNVKQLQPDYAYKLTKYMKAETDKRKDLRQLRKVEVKLQQAISDLESKRKENGGGVLFNYFGSYLLQQRKQREQKSVDFYALEEGHQSLTTQMTKKPVSAKKSVSFAVLPMDATSKTSPTSISVPPMAEEKPDTGSARRSRTPDTGRLHTPDTDRSKENKDSGKVSAREYTLGGPRERSGSPTDATPRGGSREGRRGIREPSERSLARGHSRGGPRERSGSPTDATPRSGSREGRRGIREPSERRLARGHSFGGPRERSGSPTDATLRGGSRDGKRGIREPSERRLARDHSRGGSRATFTGRIAYKQPISRPPRQVDLSDKRR